MRIGCGAGFSADRLEPAPDDLSGRAKKIQIRGLVAFDARRQDLALENRSGQRRARELINGGEKCIQPGPRPRDALPVREETREGRRLDRLDFPAQPRERTALQRPKNLGIAPLARAPAG